MTPRIIYGTAWKEQETEGLTYLALRSGFRAIDTANQRKHYFEAGVGAALSRAIHEGLVRREELFLQTKFTDAGGQDHRLPYDSSADYATQVEQSFESSLEHLGTSYLDSYVLHGPTTSHGLADEDWEIWRAMERLAKDGRAKVLGASNVDRAQLEALVEGSAVRPAFVQNRCFARYGWDEEVRSYCKAHGTVYQGFSLLTANPQVSLNPELARLAAQREKTAAQLVFAYAIEIGILPLTGTTNAEHMRQDLEALEVVLTSEERSLIERLSTSARRGG
jgi:diketogulonate reductase-like aldo/keto reductase